MSAARWLTFLAAAVAAAVVADAGAATAASTACAPAGDTAQRARAGVIFVGVAVDGPTETGIQRFRVQRYVKGSGPALVRVATGTIRHHGGEVAMPGVSLRVEKGERWRIVGRIARSGVVQSTLCAGSRRL